MAKEKNISEENWQLVETIPLVRTVEDAVKPELLVFDKYEARLAELRDQYGNVTINGVGDKEGLEKAKIARRELRGIRTGTEDDRKSAKSFYLECGRAIDKKAEWVKDNVLLLETPIDNQIKEVEAEVDRIKQERIAAEIERSKIRVSQLKNLGVEWDGANYSLDDISFTAEVIRESDDDYFYQKIVPQFAVIFDAKEKIRLANEKAIQDERDRQEQQRKDFEKQQQELKEQQDELKRQEQELEKKRFAALADRTKKRAGELEKLGMVYNFQTEKHHLKDLEIGQFQIMGTDEEWDELLKNLKPEIEKVKVEIKEEDERERARLDKEAVERSENEKRQQDELRRQKEREELEEGNDLDRWTFFLKTLPKEFPVMESRQYKIMIEDAREKIEYLRSLKATRKTSKANI